MSRLEAVGELVLTELERRLTRDPCGACGRGAEAHKVAATALAKIANDVERLQMARHASKEGDEGVRTDLNPMALVATIEKLPGDHEKRAEMVDVLEGVYISLGEAIRRLRG